MSERFVPLALYLRPPAPDVEVRIEPAPEPLYADVEEAIGAARRFRAALADALDMAVTRLLREIATNVLGRELQIAPGDVSGLVAAALTRFEGERVLAIRAHPADLDRLANFGIECAADSRLCRGELIFEVKSGTIDMRFGARLDAAIAACAP